MSRSFRAKCALPFTVYVRHVGFTGEPKAEIELGGDYCPSLSERDLEAIESTVKTARFEMRGFTDEELAGFDLETTRAHIQGCLRCSAAISQGDQIREAVRCMSGDT